MASLPPHSHCRQVFCLAPNTGSVLPTFCDQLWPWAEVAKGDPASPSQRLSIKFHHITDVPFSQSETLPTSWPTIITSICPSSWPSSPHPPLSYLDYSPLFLALELLGTTPCLSGFISQSCGGGAEAVLILLQVWWMERWEHTLPEPKAHWLSIYVVLLWEKTFLFLTGVREERNRSWNSCFGHF